MAQPTIEGGQGWSTPYPDPPKVTESGGEEQIQLEPESLLTDCQRSSGDQRWAFDASTSWHHRGMPLVGITRTEIEYARYICAHHPNTLLTVYDHRRQCYLILSAKQRRELLGNGSSSPAGPACPNESNVAMPAAEPSSLPSVGTGRRTKYRMEIATLLLLLLVLPSKSSAHRKLRRHVLKRLAKRGLWLSDGWREVVERWLHAHPSKPKYLQEYLALKSRLRKPAEMSSMAVRRLKRLDFSKIDKYISVGCGWDKNDLEAIYRAKQQHGFSVTTCVYDLVPMVMPDVAAPRLSELFPPYLRSLLVASDSVACISESTKSDLEEFIQATSSPPPYIDVCRLGSAPTPPEEASRPRVADHLAGRPFALCVATFEPRKNHEFLHFLWSELVRRRNVDPIPLVLAGGRGWRTENILERMQLNTKLFPEYLVFAEGCADAEIAWLYRNCRFTVFPSLYEGWGLPISESLSYGKFCIASDNSSLREAGQGLIQHKDLLDGRDWLAEIERCIGDDVYLGALEENITRNFKPRTWQKAAAEFFSFVCRTGTSKANCVDPGGAKNAA